MKIWKKRGEMYLLLKRLELQGFKSFADKTILEFVEGSTAVVGPNGSGKVIFPTLFVGLSVK